MYTLKTLTLAAIKMFVRNRQALFFTLFMPMIIMLIFGLIGFDKPQQIDLGLVTGQPTPATTAFLEQVKGITAFDVTSGDEASEAAALEKGERAVVLIVPDSLLPDVTSQTPPQKQTIRVLTNVGQPQQVQAALSILQQLFDQTTLRVANAPALFELKPEAINSRNLKYIDFLVPGIIGLAVMQMSVFSVAFVFVDYKEKGILKRLLATPMKPSHFVTANVITRLLVVIAQTAILVAVGVLLFHAHVFGSYALLVLIALIGGVMFLGLGFTISGFAKTVETVPAVANLVVFPMLFLGGTFFPIDTMPVWLQHVVKYLPLSYFTHALREVTTNAAGLGAIRSDLLWMAGWAVALVTFAIFAFRFEEKRVG